MRVIGDTGSDPTPNARVFRMLLLAICAARPISIKHHLKCLELLKSIYCEMARPRFSSRSIMVEIICSICGDVPLARRKCGAKPPCQHLSMLAGTRVIVSTVDLACMPVADPAEDDELWPRYSSSNLHPSFTSAFNWVITLALNELACRRETWAPAAVALTCVSKKCCLVGWVGCDSARCSGGREFVRMLGYSLQSSSRAPKS